MFSRSTSLTPTFSGSLLLLDNVGLDEEDVAEVGDEVLFNIG